MKKDAHPARAIPPRPPRGRRGVVAVILRETQFLVIRRSLSVTAPGMLCFPGGGIEPGEREEQTLVREMREELNLEVAPVERLWRSVTPWGTRLAWWLAEIPADVQPLPNPEEVADVFWMDHGGLHTAANLLPSVPQFLGAWSAGRLRLPIECPDAPRSADASKNHPPPGEGDELLP